METCENCNRLIGNLETPYLHDGHVVCADCKQRLSIGVAPPLHQPTVTPPPAMPQHASPLDALAQAANGPRRVHGYYPPAHPYGPAAASSTRRVWKNVSLLGLALFAVGAVLEFSGAPACGWIGVFGLLLWLVAGVVALSMKS